MERTRARDLGQSPPSILALLSDVGGYGGIQTFSRHLVATLAPISSLTVFGLNDPKGIRPADRTPVEGGGVAVRGFGRNKIAFAMAGVRASRGKDLVFVGHPNFGSLIPFLGRERVAVLLYGNDGWERLGRLRRTGLGRAHAVGAISRHTLDRSLERQGINPEVTFLLEPALDPGFLPIRDDLPRSTHPRILTVSRLDGAYRYKGVDEVLRAIPSLLGRFPELEYVVAGDGDDLPRLRALSADLQVENNVLFTGFLELAELHRLYASSHVFVLMSSEEGFGLVFLEAMAYGLPVVAASAGAAPDVLDHGGAGVLVPKDDIGALDNALSDLLENPSKAAELGRHGRRKVMSFYLPEHFDQRVESMLDRLLGTEAKVSAR